MKKQLSSILPAVILAATLMSMHGCAKKLSPAQPIAQNFSVQTEAEWTAVNPRFASAFDYLRSVDISTMEPGVYQIDGSDVYIIISDVELRGVQDAPLEAHDLYYDIHIPVSAPESCGYRDRRECLQPQAPMDAEKDIQFFSDPVSAVTDVQPMQFIVFSPGDAHAPAIGSGTIRKAVVKIRK